MRRDENLKSSANTIEYKLLSRESFNRFGEIVDLPEIQNAQNAEALFVRYCPKLKSRRSFNRFQAFLELLEIFEHFIVQKTESHYKSFFEHFRTTKLETVVGCIFGQL